MDYGESLEKAAVREAKEETNLRVEIIKQFQTYSDPKRDPRHHSISTVYIAKRKNMGSDRNIQQNSFLNSDLWCPP